MKQALAALFFVVLGAPAMAQMTPVGVWKITDCP